MFRKLSTGNLLAGIYLFSVPVFSHSESWGLSYIPQIIGFLIVVYAAYIILSKMYFYNNYALYIYFGFCIWTVFSSFFSPHQVDSFAILSLLKIALISGGISFLIQKPGDLKIILLFYFFSIFLNFILNFNDIMWLRTEGELQDDMRFAGTFENANSAATYALSVIWSGIFVLVSSRRRFLMRLFILTGIFLAGFVIIYSGSRQGILGSFVLAFGFSYLSYKRYGHNTTSRFLIIIGVIVSLSLLSYVMITSPFFSRITSIFTIGESSFSLRAYLIKESLNVWSSSPRNFFLGIGYGNFHLHNYLRLYSHNTFTETLVTTGLVGFLLFFTSIGSIFVFYYKLLKTTKGKTKIEVFSVMVFLVLFLFFSLLSVMITERVFWPMIGLFYAHGMILKYGPLQDPMEKTPI